jgi:hypothetical protein
VIKLSRLPGRGVVADLASLGKALLRVIRIIRALKIFQVARDARGIGQVVVVVDVALRTRRFSVCPGQGEA